MAPTTPIGVRGMGVRSHGSQILNADGRMWFPGVSLRLVLLPICATQRSKLNGSKPRSKRWLSGLNGDRSRLGNLRGERSSSLALPLASVPFAGYSTTAELRSNALKSQCPLFPRKRTLLSATWMSALCQKRTLRQFTSPRRSQSSSHPCPPDSASARRAFRSLD
jgi:hypothetical protein